MPNTKFEHEEDLALSTLSPHASSLSSLSSSFLSAHEKKQEADKSIFLNKNSQFHKKIANVSNLVKKEKRSKSLIVPLLIPLPSKQTWNVLIQNAAHSQLERKSWLNYLKNIVQNHRKAEKSHLHLIYLDRDNILDKIILAINKRYDLIKVGYRTIANVNADLPDEFLQQAIDMLSALTRNEQKIYSDKILFRPNCLSKNLCVIQNNRTNISNMNNNILFSADEKKWLSESAQASVNAANLESINAINAIKDAHLLENNQWQNPAETTEEINHFKSISKLAIPITLNVIASH